MANVYMIAYYWYADRITAYVAAVDF